MPRAAIIADIRLIGHKKPAQGNRSFSFAVAAESLRKLGVSS